MPDGGLVGGGAVLPIHRDVAQAAHDGSGDLVVEDLLLGHEPHLATQALLVGGQPREREVQVAGVVDRDDRTAARREVLHTRDRDLQPLRAPYQAG